MELSTLNGRYTIAEAEKLLKNLLKVETDFHLLKINTVHYSELQILNSESELTELKNYIKETIETTKRSGLKEIVLHTKLVIEYCPGYLTA